MIRIELPWRALFLDNNRMRPVIMRGRKGSFARMVNTGDYKKAKKLARGLIAMQYRGRPLEGPVVLRVEVFVPDNGRRDVSNYAKMIGDAITGTVIVDDRWQVLRRTTWEVPRIDRENPRAVLTIEPYEESE